MTAPTQIQREGEVDTDRAPLNTAACHRPRGLLLDFGSVVSMSLFERHRDTEQLLGLRQGTLTWLGPLDPGTDTLWKRMQQDEITEREYWAARAREIGEHVGQSGWDMQMLMERVRQTDPDSVVRPEIALLIRDAQAQGIKVGILSNELQLFYGELFLSRLSLLKQLDAFVDCTHSTILKPDPRAYALALEALQLAPPKVLFVDDQFRNIAGAVKAGLQTQHFDLRDIAGNVAAIRARLGLRIV